MEVEGIIKKYKNKIFDGKIFFYPSIPQKKIKNAINLYADLNQDEEPLVLIDDTVFGSGKNGLLLTDKYLYIKDSNNKKSYSCALEDIEKITFKNYLLIGKLTVNDTLEIDFTQPSKKSLIIFTDMLEEIIGLKKDDSEPKTSWSNIGIGVGIGALFGGPIGAAIGGAIGASLETKQSIKNNTSNNDEIIFIVTLSSIVAKMAKADGVITQEEANTISKIFTELGFDDKTRELAKKSFKNAKDDKFSIYDYAKQYKDISDYNLREFLYSILWLVAVSDGVLHPKEEDILKRITKHLGLSQSKFDEYKLEFFDDNDIYEEEFDSFNIKDCYNILGCNPMDDMHIIKRKYIKLIAEYHPDKIQSKNLPDSFMKFATEQTQKINLAYETIKKERGT